VKKLGAIEAFDYRSPTCGDDIRAFTENSLSYAIDCITTTASMKICYESLGTAGGRYVSLDPFPLRGHVRRSVKPSWVLALTMFGKTIPWARPYQRRPRPQDRVFARKWMEMAEGLLAEGKIAPHPHRTMSGGLRSVPEGIEAVRTGKVSGVKLVYPIC
jgi:aspyridone synthetase trans-acting enoyl reductase